MNRMFAALKAMLFGDTGTEHQPLKRGGTRARRGNPKKKARGLLVNGRPRSRHAKAKRGPMASKMAGLPKGNVPCGAPDPNAYRGSCSWQRGLEQRNHPNPQ